VRRPGPLLGSWRRPRREQASPSVS
jgi:hypothetical protein